jgi:hypothetical protein
MSQLEVGLRPNSAIFIGKEPVSSPDPLDVSHPLGDSLSLYPGTPPASDKRLGQLPSPPHTNSTSGSTGDKDSANAGSVRRSRVPLPVVAVHDEDQHDTMEAQIHHQNVFHHEYDDYDQTRLQNRNRLDPSADNRPTPKLDRSLSAVDRNREVSIILFLGPVLIYLLFLSPLLATSHGYSQKLNERLDRYANLALRTPSSSASGPSHSPLVKSRTISLGRASGSAAAAAAVASAGLTR